MFSYKISKTSLISFKGSNSLEKLFFSLVVGV